MKISVCSVCLPEYTPEETVRILKTLGYRGVEWRVACPPPAVKPAGLVCHRRYWSYNRCTVDETNLSAEARRLGKLCDDAGIETVMLSSYRGIWETEAAEQLMRAAALFGCRNVRIRAPEYDGTENYRRLFDRAVAQARVIEQLARQYRVRVNFEIHMGNIIPSASAAYRFVCGFDPSCIGVIYDPGNFIFEGYENYGIGVELLGEYLVHVHVKNAVWKIFDSVAPDADRWTAEFAPLSRGYANYVRILRVLKAAKYDGFLSVEDFSDEEDTLVKLKNDLSFLHELLRSI